MATVREKSIALILPQIKKQLFVISACLRYISADSNYVYFDNLQSIYIDKIDENDRKIFVYDKSGKYVTEITPKNPKDDCYFGGDDMMIFKENIDGETAESDGAKGYYVLDKSQLKSPDKQFIDME